MCSLLPSSTKRPIQLNNRQQSVSAKDRFNKLALKQVSFRIEYLKVTIQTSLISDERETVRFSQSIHEELVLFELLGGLAVSHQRIGNLAECSLDCLLISDDHFALHGFCELHI